MWSRKLKTCRLTNVHWGIFRKRLLSDDMLTFKLAAGNFYLTYFLPNMIVTCTYFLKIAEHIIKWQLKNILKFMLSLFYITYFESQEITLKSVFLSPLQTTDTIWRGHSEVVSSWVWRKNTTNLWVLILERTRGYLQEQMGQIIRGSPQKVCPSHLPVDKVPGHPGQCQTHF